MHGKEELVLLNKDIINNLTNDKRVVKALVIHELYHIYLSNQVTNLKKAIKSEKEDKNIFAKEFPVYYKSLDRQKGF